jgi:hypothetical protein
VRLLVVAIIAAVVGAAAGFAGGWIAADRNDGADEPDLAAEERLARTALAAAFFTGNADERCEKCSIEETWHVGERTWIVRYRTPTGADRIRCAAVDIEDVKLGDGDYPGIENIACDAVDPEP